MFFPLLMFANATVTESTFFDLSAKTIDGKPVSMKVFKGKVLLVVNVASKCGNTPQYAGLESLYGTYKAKGFEVLGFPANNFGSQEPGTNAQIKEFCESTYHVTFPMFSKVSVSGDDQDPIYKWLIETGPRKDNIEWNFAKFLIGRDGKIVARFGPKVQPDSPDLVKSLESALSTKAP